MAGGGDGGNTLAIEIAVPVSVGVALLVVGACNKATVRSQKNPIHSMGIFGAVS